MAIVLVVLSFLVSLAFFTVERLLFLLWNHTLFQSQPASSLWLAFFYGLRFDIAVAAIVLAPVLLIAITADFSDLAYREKSKIWVRRILLSLVFLVQLPAMILNILDAEFVNFMGRRMTQDSFFLVRETQGKILHSLVYYWRLAGSGLIILIGFALTLYYLYQNYRGAEVLKFWRVRILLAITSAVLLVIGARGGLQLKPIGFPAAQKFALPIMNSLVVNSGFTLWQSFDKETLPRDHFFNDHDQMMSLLDGSIKGPSLLDGHRSAQKQNVVLIILESFSLEFTGAVNDGKGYTPFLDELGKKGFFFRRNYANARRSIEGIGALLGGIPALMNEPFISSQYQTNYFLGLGTLLSAHGYHTSFFHGAHNGSMYFDEFMKSAGIANYYGFNEFPDKSQDDGTWGIYDEPFFQFMIQNLNTFPQPFFSAVFSLTSHSPFRIPDQYQGKFPKGTMEIHEAVGYTDYAVRRFFEEASKQPWYKNTLFIITADHTFKSGNPAFNNEIGQYRIPLILFHPTQKLPEVDLDEITEQVDILPTVLDYVDATENELNYLGRSIFVPGPRTAVTFTDNQYLEIQKDYFLQYRRGMEPKLFSINDPFEKTELQFPEIKENLNNHLKAELQYFSEGMWDNKLYFPK